jgi:spermidine/putrescine transport system permease protein
MKPAPASARLSGALLGSHAVLTYLFLYAPIVILVIFSFNAGRQASVWHGFSTKWYAELAKDEALRNAALNSLAVAGAATAISTAIGTLAAVGLSRYRFRGRDATRALLYLPVVIPEIVLGVSLLTLFGAAGVDLSMTTVILAHVAFTVSYVAVVVKARLAGLDRSIEEAAMDLGAGPVGAFVRVTLPQLWPGVVAAALLVFTISLDDYVVTSLVCGVDSQTLPIKVYSMLRVTVTPEVNAACTVLLAVTVAAVVAAQRLMMR